MHDHVGGDGDDNSDNKSQPELSRRTPAKSGLRLLRNHLRREQKNALLNGTGAWAEW